MVVSRPGRPWQPCMSPRQFVSARLHASSHCAPCHRDVLPAGPAHASLCGPGETYLLELLIGAAGVPQEAIGVEDAAGIVLVAPQVVAGCEVARP